MRILLSNDDGVYAPGLRILHRALSNLATVTVVAPDRDRSAASKSLTLNSPLRPKEIEPGFISINGTPTDCVHFALTGGGMEMPDMVVAGINAGANLGDDVLYSGTVSAATEGRSLGFPAIAVSLVGEKEENYSSAARIVCLLIQKLQQNSLPPDTILNINVPDLPYEKLKGFEVTRLGQRHRAENMIKGEDPRGRTIYWIGPPGPEQDAGFGTDFDAVRRGYVSISPIQMDLTRHQMIEPLKQWMVNIPLYENI